MEKCCVLLNEENNQIIKDVWSKLRKFDWPSKINGNPIKKCMKTHLKI